MKFRVIKLALLFAISLVMSVTSVTAQTESGLPDDEIEAYPYPDVRHLLPNDRLINDRIYRRVNGPVSIHDAPNGNITSTMAAGFNFVTVLSSAGDWVEISPGRWVRAESLTDDVPLSRFAGVMLPEEPLPYTPAWILVNVRPSTRPGGDPSPDNPMLLRYTLVNIYDSVEVGMWRWYQVGINQWVNQTLVAKVLPVERPEDVDTERWISVDLYEQVAIAYEGERPVFATLVSSGLAEWPTNEGLFNIYVRYPRTLMSGAYGQPDFYYLEEVPWTMYFDNEIALHGAYWHDGFGYRRSHGCVNLSITDAHWLYNWASEEFDFTVPNDLGAAVYVYSSDTYR